MISFSVPRRFLGAIPQLLTGLRLSAGAAALVLASLGRTALAATLVIMFVVTDALDGAAARRFDVESEFGALFDYFADYLNFVIVPVTISIAMFRREVGIIALGIFGVPVVTGAIRYARNVLLTRQDSFDNVGFPGLGTMFYGFFVFALCFLDREAAVNKHMLAQVLLIFIGASTLLMVSQIRYPKLAKYSVVLVPVLLGLNIMPYYATSPLAFTTLLLIVIYMFCSPVLVAQPWLRDRFNQFVARVVAKND